MVGILLGLTVYEWEKGRDKGCMKAHCSFSFSYCEVYLSAASLEGSQSSLTTEDMFSLCENQPLWYAGKMLFFTPNCCLWKASAKNYFSLQSELIEATIWKVHALIFDHSVLYENSKFACVILEVNFPLWSVNVQNVCNTHHKKADGFFSWISLLLNYIATLSREVFSLITILLKNTAVILDSYKMEDGVVS